MKGSKLFTASWILLLILTIALAFFSLASAWVAFSGQNDQLASSTTLEHLRAVSEEAVTATRGRRVTAATWALAYAILSAWIVLGPYRRGERWAWWALLVSLGLSQIISLARIPLIGTSLGAVPSATLLAVLALGLLAGAPRIFSRSAP